MRSGCSVARAAAMTAADWRGLDPQRYQFTFVRREFQGEARCLVFDVQPKTGSPDGFSGLCARYHLQFAGSPKVMDLGLIYRALVDHQVDVVAGNSTDGLIDALGLVALEDDQHYFPPYDAVPIVRESTLEPFPQLRAALADLAGKLSASDIRKLNYAVDAQHQDAAAAVRAFRAERGL